MPVPNRRAADDVRLPIYLRDDHQTVPGPDGELSCLGFKAYLDEARTVELIENDRSPVLPGVFFTRVIGVSFHDDVLQLPHFGAGQPIEIRPEPANPLDRDALAVLGGGQRVGFVPAAISNVLAPSGTRVGRGVILKEWSSNGMRQDIWILGSMHVHLAMAMEDRPATD
jgi:hypothetical protein